MIAPSLRGLLPSAFPGFQPVALPAVVTAADLVAEVHRFQEGKCGPMPKHAKKMPVEPARAPPVAMIGSAAGHMSVPTAAETETQPILPAVGKAPPSHLQVARPRLYAAILHTHPRGYTPPGAHPPPCDPPWRKVPGSPPAHVRCASTQTIAELSAGNERVSYHSTVLPI